MKRPGSPIDSGTEKDAKIPTDKDAGYIDGNVDEQASDGYGHVVTEEDLKPFIGQTDKEAAVKGQLKMLIAQRALFAWIKTPGAYYAPKVSGVSMAMCVLFISSCSRDIT